jgi:hypothetical protein
MSGEDTETVAYAVVKRRTGPDQTEIDVVELTPDDGPVTLGKYETLTHVASGEQDRTPVNAKPVKRTRRAVRDLFHHARGTLFQQG